MRDHFVKTMLQIAEGDPRIMLLTGDLGFGVLVDYWTRLPKQFLNVGVAEQNLTGLATGLALEGRIVFTYSIANFPILRCLEQIRNDASYHEANVKIVAIGGGFSYGPLGMSHHATEDIAVMRALANITVVSPCCFWETEEATKAIVETPGTMYLRLDKASAGRTNNGDEVFELGKARVLRNGTDITVVATGGIMEEVLSAAEKLASSGVEARVISVHTIKPLDTQTLQAAAMETGGMVVVEEHSVVGGLASAIAEELLESGHAPKTFARIGLRAGYTTIVGSQRYLRGQYGMDAIAIEKAVYRALAGEHSPA